MNLSDKNDNIPPVSFKIIILACWRNRGIHLLLNVFINEGIFSLICILESGIKVIPISLGYPFP